MTLRERFLKANPGASHEIESADYCILSFDWKRYAEWLEGKLQNAESILKAFDDSKSTQSEESVKAILKDAENL